VTAYSRTSWTLTCNGADQTREYILTGDPSSLLSCTSNPSSESAPRAVDAAGLRAYLAKRGWAVNVPVQDSHGYVVRMDFCPLHKDMHGYRIGSEWRFRDRADETAVVTAGEGT
jgi:hypothetical protein